MPTAQYGFNGNPTSVSVKTGSYTIPASNYAYITANAYDEQTVSVDGTVAVNGGGGGNANINSFNATGATGTASYTCPSSSFAELSFFCSGSEAISFNGNASVVSVNGGPFNFTLGPGGTFSTSSSTTGKQLVGYSRRDNSGVTASFWVPAGTVMSTSSGRYLVQLF